MSEAPTSGFNRLAPVYDLLARLVYGRSIVKAQTYFFSQIPANSKVLILGGGTGWILKPLMLNHPDCSICYIEASNVMLAKSRKVVGANSRVEFILGTQDDIPNTSFDVIVTHFFLDLFSPSNLRDVVRKISRAATPSALWLIADFQGERAWQKYLLGLMYLFFRVTARIEARRLPPWQEALEESGFMLLKRHAFYREFIESQMRKGKTGRE